MSSATPHALLPTQLAALPSAPPVLLFTAPTAAPVTLFTAVPTPMPSLAATPLSSLGGAEVRIHGLFIYGENPGVLGVPVPWLLGIFGVAIDGWAGFGTEPIVLPGAAPGVVPGTLGIFGVEGIGAAGNGLVFNADMPAALASAASL